MAAGTAAHSYPVNCLLKVRRQKPRANGRLGLSRSRPMRPLIRPGVAAVPNLAKSAAVSKHKPPTRSQTERKRRRRLFIFVSQTPDAITHLFKRGTPVRSSDPAVDPLQPHSFQACARVACGKTCALHLHRGHKRRALRSGVRRNSYPGLVIESH